MEHHVLISRSDPRWYLLLHSLFCLLRMGKWFCLFGMSSHSQNSRGRYSHHLDYFGLAWLFPLMNEIMHWEIFCLFLIIVFSSSFDLSEFRLNIFRVLETQKHRNTENENREKWIGKTFNGSNANLIHDHLQGKMLIGNEKRLWHFKWIVIKF